jgi:hypothetical protein
LFPWLVGDLAIAQDLDQAVARGIIGLGRRFFGFGAVTGIRNVTFGAVGPLLAHFFYKLGTDSFRVDREQGCRADGQSVCQDCGV